MSRISQINNRWRYVRGVICTAACLVLTRSTETSPFSFLPYYIGIVIVCVFFHKFIQVNGIVPIITSWRIFCQQLLGRSLVYKRWLIIARFFCGTPSLFKIGARRACFLVLFQFLEIPGTIS